MAMTYSLKSTTPSWQESCVINRSGHSVLSIFTQSSPLGMTLFQCAHTHSTRWVVVCSTSLLSNVRNTCCAYSADSLPTVPSQKCLWNSWRVISPLGHSLMNFLFQNNTKGNTVLPTTAGLAEDRGEPQWKGCLFRIKRIKVNLSPSR